MGVLTYDTYSSMRNILLIKKHTHSCVRARLHFDWVPCVSIKYSHKDKLLAVVVYAYRYVAMAYIVTCGA